jgi:hypothetical protein
MPRENMAKTPQNRSAGGFFIAIGAILGVFGGRYWGGQTTIGLLAGLATGGAIALIIWLRGRR